MCPRLRAGPQLAVETQSHLLWGWLSDPALALCPCAPRWRHHLAHPVHHLSCGVHGPAPLHLALSSDASRGGPQRPLGDAWGVEFGTVRRHLPYLPHGAVSSRLRTRPPESDHGAHPVWAAAASVFGPITT